MTENNKNNAETKQTTTNDLSAEKTVYNLLSKVLRENAYSQIALNDALKSNNSNSNYISKLFYGVLEKSIQFDYIISKLVTAKPPKPAIKILLKIGLYLLRYMDIPNYAAVNKTVELTKQIGKGDMKGFVNAVLKKSIAFSLPKIMDAQSLSVNASYPLFITEMLINDYGFEFTKAMLLKELTDNTHIRVNQLNISLKDFAAKYPFLDTNTAENTYYVTHNTINQLDKNDYVVQSLASVKASEYYFEPNAQNVLDICAAPGGKSCNLYQQYYLAGNKVNITACDVHPHRVELIKKYASAVGAKITAVLNDATKLNSNFINKFDLVVCDVPCSGLGVARKKPEILFNKTKESIFKLTKLQSEILQTSSKYVKNGGSLCYSTCTVLKCENSGVVNNFLKNNPDFYIDTAELNLFPHTDDCDGFYAVKLKRK